MFRFFQQPFIGLNLKQPIRPVPARHHAQPVLLRTAAQAELNCQAIQHAQEVREQREERVKELFEIQRMERQFKFQERRF